MDFEIGQRLIYSPFSMFDPTEVVTVVGLRKRGHAKLSNGWTVDEDGIAEGTSRIPGGSVRKIVE
jgi:hypothetical protein